MAGIICMAFYSSETFRIYLAPVPHSTPTDCLHFTRPADSVRHGYLEQLPQRASRTQTSSDFPPISLMSAFQGAFLGSPHPPSPPLIGEPLHFSACAGSLDDLMEACSSVY